MEQKDIVLFKIVQYFKEIFHGERQRWRLDKIWTFTIIFLGNEKVWFILSIFGFFSISIW